MAGVLNVKSIFSVKGNVRNNLHFIEDSTIVYPAGNFIVKYSTPSNAAQPSSSSSSASGAAGGSSAAPSSSAGLRSGPPTQEFIPGSVAPPSALAAQQAVIAAANAAAAAAAQQAQLQKEGGGEGGHHDGEQQGAGAGAARGSASGGFGGGRGGKESQLQQQQQQASQQAQQQYQQALVAAASQGSVGGFTALALSTNRRYLAAAERSTGPEGALLSVFNLRTLGKRKAMTAAPHLRATEVVSLSFNLDDSLLLALTAGPAWQLGLFSVDRGRCVSVADCLTPSVLSLSCGAPVVPLACSFSSVSLSKAVVYGKGILSFYSVDERGLSPEDALALEQQQANETAAASAGAGAAAAAGAFSILTHNLTPLQQNLAFQQRAQSAGGAASPFCDYTAQCWLGDDLSLLATAAGELILFKRDQFSRILGTDETPAPDGRIIDCLVSFSRGFLAGGEGGLLRLYQFSSPEDLSHFSLVKQFKASLPPGVAIDCEDRIRAISVSPNEETAALALSGCQLLAFDLGRAAVKDDGNAFSLLGPMSHGPGPGQGYGPPGSSSGSGLLLTNGQPGPAPGGNSNNNNNNANNTAANSSSSTSTSRSDACSILNCDVAVRKPIIATVGSDNTVRVWNYVERSLEVMRVFPEGPISVSVHPSGLHLVVGFSDRLRLLNILADDLRELKEFPIKACPQVKFSNGGHAFAAANGSVVQLYSSYSGDYLSSLRGHNGKVLALHWAHNDATLLSAGLDGSIYEWCLSEGKRSREFISKGVRWSSITSSKDGTLVYAAGDGATMPTGFAPVPASSSSSSSDALTAGAGAGAGAAGGAASNGGYSGFSIREIDMQAGTVLREVHSPTPIHSLLLTLANPRMLFAATAADANSASVIRSFALPFANDPPYLLATHPTTGTPGWVDFPACSAPVVKMVASRDDSYLFVVGADGSCLAYEVRDKDGRLPASEFSVKVPWAEEVLLTLSDLEDKKNAVRDLRDQVAELQSTNDYSLRMKDIAFQESLKKLTDGATLELDGERQQFEILREEKLDLEREYTERLNSLEIAHRSEMQKRESLYQGKIMEEVERFQSLQSDVEAQRSMWNNKRTAMVASHLSYMQSLTGDYERRLEAARDRRRELEEEVEGVRRDWEEMRRQMGEDLDKEVEGMRRGYSEKLEAERDATLKFKGENGIMMKKFSALSKEMDEVGEEIRRMNDKQKALRGNITDLEKEISVLRLLSQEKDVAIQEKEQRIYDLKKKNQELEKFKFVLDYKIKELKQQIEPRENEIAAMKKQIREVDAELEAYHTSNAELDELIGKLRTQLNTLQQEGGRQRIALHRKETAMKEFLFVLHEVMETATRRPHELAALLAKMSGTSAARYGSTSNSSLGKTGGGGGALGATTGSSAASSSSASGAAAGEGGAAAKDGAAAGSSSAADHHHQHQDSSGAGAGSSSSSSAQHHHHQDDDENNRVSESDLAIIKESEKQCAHLAELVTKIKKRASEETAVHKKEGLSLISDNMVLIEQLKTLREQVAALKLAAKCWNIDRPRAVQALTGAKLNHLLPAGVGSGTGSRAGTSHGSPNKSRGGTRNGAGGASGTINQQGSIGSVGQQGSIASAASNDPVVAAALAAQQAAAQAAAAAIAADPIAGGLLVRPAGSSKGGVRSGGAAGFRTGGGSSSSANNADHAIVAALHGPIVAGPSGRPPPSTRPGSRPLSGAAHTGGGIGGIGGVSGAVAAGMELEAVGKGGGGGGIHVSDFANATGGGASSSSRAGSARIGGRRVGSANSAHRGDTTGRVSPPPGGLGGQQAAAAAAAGLMGNLSQQSSMMGGMMGGNLLPSPQGGPGGQMMMVVGQDGSLFSGGSSVQGFPGMMMPASSGPVPTSSRPTSSGAAGPRSGSRGGVGIGSGGASILDDGLVLQGDGSTASGGIMMAAGVAAGLVSGGGSSVMMASRQRGMSGNGLDLSGVGMGMGMGGGADGGGMMLGADGEMMMMGGGGRPGSSSARGSRLGGGFATSRGNSANTARRDAALAAQGGIVGSALGSSRPGTSGGTGGGGGGGASHGEGGL